MQGMEELAWAKSRAHIMLGLKTGASVASPQKKIIEKKYF